MHEHQSMRSQLLKSLIGKKAWKNTESTAINVDLGRLIMCGEDQARCSAEDDHLREVHRAMEHRGLEAHVQGLVENPRPAQHEQDHRNVEAEAEELDEENDVRVRPL